MPQNRSSIIIFLYGCATVTLLDADPFNSILNGNDYFCMKPDNLGNFLDGGSILT